MSFESFVALSFGLLFLLVAVALPVVLMIGVFLGTIDTGFVSPVESPDQQTLPAGIALEDDESPIVMTSVNRSHWVVVMAVGLLFSPLAWGLPLVVYAWRLRNRPQYVFTDQRLIVERNREFESFDIDRVGQVQVGTSTVESIINKSHVTFSIDDRKLISIGYLHNAGELAESIKRALTPAEIRG